MLNLRMCQYKGTWLTFVNSFSWNFLIFEKSILREGLPGFEVRGIHV